MTRGVLLGLTAQVAFMVGFVFINQATTFKSQLFKTTLGLTFAGLLSLGIVAYFILSGSETLATISRGHLFYLALGAVLIWVIGDTLAITGMAASSVTIVAYTALARPAIALFLEYMLGQVTPNARDLAGFGLLAAGFVVILTR